VQVLEIGNESFRHVLVGESGDILKNQHKAKKFQPEQSGGSVPALNTIKGEGRQNSSLGISLSNQPSDPSTTNGTDNGSDYTWDDMVHWSFLQWIKYIAIIAAVSIPAAGIVNILLWFFCWRPILKSNPLAFLNNINP